MADIRRRGTALSIAPRFADASPAVSTETCVANGVDIAGRNLAGLRPAHKLITQRAFAANS
jgi:hypothetical protein